MGNDFEDNIFFKILTECKKGYEQIKADHKSNEERLANCKPKEDDAKEKRVLNLDPFFKEDNETGEGEGTN